MKNLNHVLDNLLSDIKFPSDIQLKEETKAAKISLKLKGIKHSEETKKKLSKAKIGHKRNKVSVKKSIDGTKKTKWLQLLEKYPLKSILDAQLNNDNHQFNTCKELGVCHSSYKKLCKYYGIELKKSNYEKIFAASAIASIHHFCMKVSSFLVRYLYSSSLLLQSKLTY